MPPPNRRVFLAASAAAAAAARPAFSANETLGVAVMGLGGRGTSLALSFAGQPNVRIVSVSDPDAKRVNAAADKLEKAGKPRPQIVGDFRQALDDKAVDVLICAAPNHWHAPAGILACKAGKHVYVEKPCSHTLREAEWLAAAAKKHGRVVQVGTQRRSMPKWAEAVQKLRDGVIGRVYFGQAWYANDRPSIGKASEADPPAGLNYALWEGPAPHRPFRPNFLHYNWHWFWHWGNGELGNNGVHYIDILRWGLDVGLPAKVTSTGGRYKFPGDDQETPDTHVVGYDFPGGKTIAWEGFSRNRLPHQKPVECLFQGENGSLALEGGGYTVFDAKGKEVAKESGPGGDAAHIANFLAAARGNGRANADIADTAASTMLCHLGNIAHRVGRSLACDPKDGKILNDPAAMAYWSKPYAPGWEEKLS